jgi:hypothetical protein
MSAYDRQAWDVLNEHWRRRNNKRGLPNWVGGALERSSSATKKAAKAVVDVVPEAVKEPVRRAGDAVAGAAVKPALQGVVALLDLVNEWSLELNNPQIVEALARRRGLDVESFADLRHVELKDCDRLLSRNTLTWRSVGAFEGGAMGALALVPVAGIPASITLDILVIQLLSTSIAAHVAYSYGFDAKDPKEEEFIQRLVRRSFMAQAAKAEPIRDVARAADAIKGRVRWSNKLLEDHKLLAALERVMSQLSANGGKVSVESVAKVVPYVGILLGAGVNSAVLGAVAADAKRYCQTRFLCEKYSLPLPTALINTSDDDPDEEAA